ncbi:hypothetical protein [Roseicyclus sp.]|uniref:hypothetical protein n=1 Tax=Roseicyclus sp. TaxID=1914329 RepID=UPI003F9FB03F
MHRLVQTLLRLVPHREPAGTGNPHLHPSVRGSSYDRTLAAFKAEQAERAARNVRRVAGEWKSSRH